MNFEGIKARPSGAFTLFLVAAVVCLTLSADAAQAGILKVTSFTAPGLSQDQSPSITAGGRPFELVNEFTLNKRPTKEGIIGPGENARNLSFDLPPGVVGNAAAFPKCTQEAFDAIARCPIASQIGIANIGLSAGQGSPFTPVYNMEPPPGMPAQFAFRVIAANVHVNFHVRAGSDYGVTAKLSGLSTALGLMSSKVQVWGVPGDPVHDALRFSEGVQVGAPYPELPPFRAFLSNPTSCGGPLVSTMEAVTWQLPGQITSAAPFEAPAMINCDQPDFNPTIEARPTTNLADSPSGLEFNLHLPQGQDAEGLATAHLRESRVLLPASLTVNPSSANGLGACTPAQIGYLGGSNERQLIRYELPLSASFTVGFRGQTTAPILAVADRGDVTEAVETLPGLAGNVSLSGAPGGWIVSFNGALAGVDVPDLTGTVANNPTQRLEITGEGGGYTLHSGGGDTNNTFQATFGAGEGLISVFNAKFAPTNNDLIEGPGITPGTSVEFTFDGVSLFITPATAEAQTAAHLVSPLRFNASATKLEEVLQGVPSIGFDNVSVTETANSGSTRSFQLLFGGALTGTEPVLTATDSLVGLGAGVAITTQPPAPGHPLHVATLSGGVASGTPQFTPGPANCPDASKIGTVRVDSPAVIDHPLTGNVYLASQNENPFGSLLAMYIAVDDPQSGVVLKLPGKIDADPSTGQLTATVSEAPQLPFEDLHLEFLKGAVAPLKTGIACGTSSVNTDMVPWTSPEGATQHPQDSFTIAEGGGGGACVGSEAAAPNTPKLEVGTADPVAGDYSPFTLKLSRADGTQQLIGIDTTLPRGLLAKLAGVPYCSNQALAAAAAKSGKAEQISPSCPAASRVGSVTVGAGAGPRPFYAGGSAYLAGPYKGAPLSLAVVTPAVAGPFDLGTVVVRNALYVNSETAQVHAVSDRFPTILQGIPLDLRSVAVVLDRSRFTRNPTSCNPLEINAAATALTGQSAQLSQRFQVGDCAKLAFKPKLALSLRGGTERGDYPALKAVLTAKDGEAGIARTSVALPHSEFLAQNHIKTICTRVQFTADACPKGSIYGTATATTPLLDQPLTGPVYLRSSSNPLPDLVVALHGQIDVDLVGRIDSVRGGIRTTFEEVPDAPVSKFVLSMQGGKKGLLQNSRDICKAANRATVEMDGQNAKFANSRPVLKAQCKAGKKSKGKRRH